MQTNPKDTSIAVKPLRRKDFRAARRFAIEGMHLSWYASNAEELYLYSYYFWCLEISRASRALGAYKNGALVGVLLADTYDTPKAFPSFWRRLFVRFATWIIRIGYTDASDTYDSVNQALQSAFLKSTQADGELNFFAVDPSMVGNGLGTTLLNELETLEKGKTIFLFTDSGSTYQFYLRRGFTEFGKREISLPINRQQIPLTCYLFSKKL